MTPKAFVQIALVGMLAVAALPAHAQERGREFGRGEPLRYDQRYHHNHYYPARGYAFAELPRGSVRIGWRGGDFWYHGGVWFRPEGGRFVVAAPPFGVVVPVLPADVATVTLASGQYYYANGVYYAPTAGEGYRVVAPPPGAEPDPDGADYAPGAPSPYGPGDSGGPPPGQPYPQGPSSPQPPGYAQAAPPPRQGASGEPIVYPRNGQPPQQLEADRTDCLRWATQNSVGGSAGVFQRAFGACMDGRGYTVR